MQIWNNDRANKSKEIINDLSLIYDHLHKNGGKFITFIKGKRREKGKYSVKGMHFIHTHNLHENELLEVYHLIIDILKHETKTQNCNNIECILAKKEIAKIIKNYDEMEKNKNGQW